jgi:hypothetical protein
MLNNSTPFYSKQVTSLVMYLFCICKITSLGLSWGANILTGIFHSSSVYTDKWQDSTYKWATTASFQIHPFASYLVLSGLWYRINKFINIQGQVAADREFIAVWWFIVTKQTIQNCQCWIWSRKFLKHDSWDSGTLGSKYAVFQWLKS